MSNIDEYDFSDVEDIYEARRIMKIMAEDVKKQFYGKIFFTCTTALSLIALIISNS